MSFLGQFFTALRTFIKLKRWRFLWLVIFLLSALSNHVLYNVVGTWVANFGLQRYLSIDGNDFADNSAIVGTIKGREKYFSVLTSLINEQRKSAKSAKYKIQDCSGDGTEDCSMQLLSLMIGQRSNKFSHYVEFPDPDGKHPKVICNMAYGSEVYCPYIASLVSTASYGVQDAPFRFKSITTFRFVPTGKPPQKVRSGADSMCAKDPEYSIVMPRTIIVQTFLLLCSAFIYLLASTLPCVGDLKGRGFMKLLFRRGFSVAAYWLALWTVTLIELLLVGALLAASHYIQCPGFYAIERLARLVLVFAVQMCSIVSLAYLLTVIIQKQFVIAVAVLLLASACCMVLALSLILLHWLPGLAWTRNALMALPLGLVGEQLQAVLVSQLRPSAETNFHSRVLLISAGVWAVSLLLTLYLDFVLSSGNGLFLRVPHFPCAMLCGRKRRQLDHETLAPPQLTVEPVSNLRPVVQIRHMSKVFDSCTNRRSVRALTNVSVTLYENQLAAFVGHNGSGKSTLFNVLTGKTIASSGDFFLTGYNMSDARIRYKLASIIGICHQYDALCNGISVADSIRLVQSACGVRQANLDPELDHILTALGLEEKLSQKVCNLSSGQKRKLCTALALLGNPSLIILDEPTCNLDPVSRRQLWKLLQEYRLGRCIVLSTSLMDEADVQADRKMFLSGGSLICAGSSLFLRRAFDCGFIFQTIVKTERHVAWVLRSVNRSFPTVRARSLYRSNIELEVPATEDRLLPGVAAALEKLPDMIEAFGLAQHSLDQIFTRLRSMPQADIERLFKTGEIGYTVEDPLDSSQPQQARPSVVAPSQWSRHFTRHEPTLKGRVAAMLVICWARIRRKGSSMFSRIVFPVLLLLLLIASLIGERMAKGSQLNLWASLVGIRGENFTKGLCIDDSDLPGHRHYPLPKSCKELLALKLNRSEDTYIFTSKLKKTSIYSHFNDVVLNKRDFQAQCAEKHARYEPCPVIYASDWCEDSVTNSVREISLGFYSLYEYFDISLATEYLLWIYRRALERYNSKLATNVTMNVDVIGVKEFRTTFIPLFGAFFQMIILCIIPATYLDDLTEDKASGVRNQIRALGMGSGHYWFCIFVTHWVQYSIIYTLGTVLMFAILAESYFNSCFILWIYLPTLVLGLTSNQLSAYLLSTIFERQNTAVTVVYSIFSVVLGLSLLLAQLDNMAGLILICAFPPVASVAVTFYGTKLIIYTLAFMKVKALSELSTHPLRIPTMSLHITVAVIAMVAHIFLLCLAIFIMERRQAMKCCCCKLKKQDTDPMFPISDDLGVQEETDRLDRNSHDGRNSLEVRHLRVMAGSGENIIRDITFAVKPGEILGLLGPNGSGKTTLVSAIAGDLEPHGGDCEVLVQGTQWLPCNVAASGGKIGYCQSSDPLLSHVTVEEHLVFYAAVLGVSSDDCQKLVQELLDIFQLVDVRDRMTCQISNGCKRRLSMAISMLGDPSVVVIDDPSEGVDPDSKRLIWAAIKSIASENRAVVVTMHTMADGDGLCTRVGIMNHGLLVGIGTTDQILNRYGQIYTLSIQLEEDLTESNELRKVRVENLLKAVRTKFPAAFVVEQMAASVLVCVPVVNIDRLSNVLKWLVDSKKSLAMATFSLRRVYLDEIFELVIKNHDDKLLKQRHSIFSMVETLPLSYAANSVDS